MKTLRAFTIPGLVLVTALGITSCAGTGSKKLQGTWELAWPEMGPQFRELKHITPTHFMWVTYDTDAGMPVTCGGGRYFLVGDSYNEHIEFGMGPVSELVGSLQTFRVVVEGDTLVQTGTLTTGGELREVWVRAKSEEPPQQPPHNPAKPLPRRSDPLGGNSR